MRADVISSQNMRGRVIGCSWFRPKQRKVFQQVRACLENVMQKKDYDIKISLFWGKLRISVIGSTEYSELNSDSPDIWINHVKEFIKDYEKRQNECVI